MKIKVEKRLHADDVQRLCIKQNYYTCGDIEAYDKMLTMCNSNKVTNQLIYKIAVDIAIHSDLDRIYNQYGVSYKEFLEALMFEINKLTDTFFEIEK